jgi:ABC-type transporter Mla MlaB component
MRVSEVLAEAWHDLENEDSRVPGTYERRVFSQSGKTIYLTLTRPAETGAIQIIAPQRALRGWQELETRGFQLKLEPIPKSTAVRIRIELLAAAFTHPFRQLCSDVIAQHLAHDTEDSAAATWQRITRWQRFFELTDDDGLSAERQIGLYGELFFIRRAIQNGSDAARILDAWQGPDGANQDFAFGPIAVEVKTSCNTRETQVSISNVRQLDDAGLASLFLCHLGTERRKGAGETLPEIVSHVREMLSEFEISFSDKLIASGYLEDNASLYTDYGYVLRNLSFYRVALGFPRILSRDIATGVSEITYVIELAAASNHLTSEHVLFSSLKGTDDGTG